MRLGMAVVLSPEHQELKLACETNLETMIKFVHPKRMLGNLHREVIHNFWGKQDAKQHQMLLLPRDHMKSALLAYRIVQRITVKPWSRILLLSSTSNLATKQLKFIKDIITSDRYRMFWPEMVNVEEAKREKWTEREISIDHPRRRDEAIRDPTIFTAGLTTNIVGMHCDVAAFDDVVVSNNAYTQEGRDKVEDQYSLLSSIETVNSEEWVAGTRYFPTDLYSKLAQMEIEEYDELGNVCKTEPLFEVFERQVESIGDGHGEFIWPRQQSPSGMWYGFDAEQLAKKRAQYLNKTHFRAQYYNDPHDADAAAIKRETFQYYDRNYLTQRDGRWFYQGNTLNVVASIDFAYSTGKKSDFTSLVVVGVDGKNNYYVLDIERFKTDRISEYFAKILSSFQKWGFRKLRAEVSVAQQVIVKDLKENYIRPYGLSLSIEEFRPSRWQGSKEERMMSTLEPKYANQQMWHYLGGNIQTLEEELTVKNRQHDDVMDALASAVDFAVAPVNMFKLKKESQNGFNYNTKFGGVI